MKHRREVRFGHFAATEVGRCGGFLYAITSEGNWQHIGSFERFGDAECAARLLHIHTEVQAVY